MAALVKATLALARDPSGSAVEVQLNPTSLRIEQTNAVDGGTTKGRQVEQFAGMSSAKVSMELVFDSADEGTTGKARNVREKTRQIARFVIPEKTGKKPAPPRVLFSWGVFVLEGVMTSMTEDIDLFSADGIPLRAKVNVSISVQDPKFALLATGPGAFTADKAKAPGAAGSGPGTQGTPNPDRTALALGGESAAEFAARVGLDPAGWRGLSGSIGSSLSLEAGAQIDFSADASVSAGVGLSVGLEAGITAGAEAALNLAAAASAGVAAGVSGASSSGASTAAGFALAAAGGVAAAAAGAASARATAAAGDARQAFNIPPPATRPSGPTRSAPGGGAGAAVSRAAGVASRAASTARIDASASVPVAPIPTDRRGSTFGYGVPLRPLVVVGTADTWAGLSATARLAGRAAAPGGPQTTDPTVPPWVALPVHERSRQAAATAATPTWRPTCGCANRARTRSGAAAACHTCGGIR